MKKIVLPVLISFLLVFSFVPNTYATTPESKSLIATMTSDQSPSGKVTYSSYYSGLPGYKAFDSIPHYSKSGYTAWGTSSSTG